MGIFIIWLVLAVIVGIAANARGRSGFIWFVFAVVISPLLAVIAVLVMRNIRYEGDWPGATTGAQAADAKMGSLPPAED